MEKNKITVSGKSFRYIPRSVLIYEGGEVRWVSAEERILKALEDPGFAVLLGLPGIGKTTTTTYIIKLFREKFGGDFPAVRITACNSPVYNVPEVRIVEGVVEIRARAEALTVEARLMNMLRILEKVAEKSDKSLLEKLVKPIMDLVESEEFQKVRQRIRKTKRLCDMLNKAIDGIRRFLKGLGLKPNERMLAIKDEIFERLEMLYMLFKETRIKRSTEITSKVLSILFPAVSLALLFLDFIDLEEELKAGQDVALRVKKSLAKKRLLIVVDDFLEFRDPERVFEFVKLCHEAGARILLVRRINVGSMFEELRTLMEERRSNRANLVYALLRTPSNMEARALERPDYPPHTITYMIETKQEEFQEIIEANIEYIRKLRRANGLPESVGDIQKWFRYTLGIPYLAIHLMCHVENPEKLKQVRVDVEEYITEKEPSKDEIKKSYLRIINSYVALLYYIMEKENSLIPFILQPTATDEYKEFCRSTSVKDCERWLERCINEGVILVKKTEIWMGRKVQYYDLDDLNMILRNLFKELAATNTTIRKYVMRWRRMLLQILSVKAMNFGETTSRMLYAALEHLLTLREWGVSDSLFKKWYIWWLSYDLSTTSSIVSTGLAEDVKLGWTLEVVENNRDDLGMLRFHYLRALAQACRTFPSPKCEMLAGRIWKILQRKPQGDLMKTWWLMAKLSTLSTIAYLIELRTDMDMDMPMHSFKLIIKKLMTNTRWSNFELILKTFSDLEVEAERIKGDLGKFVKAHIILNKLSTKSYWNKAKRSLDITSDTVNTITNIIKDLTAIKWNKELEEFLKPLALNRNQRKRKLGVILSHLIYRACRLLIKYEKLKDCQEKSKYFDCYRYINFERFEREAKNRLSTLLEEELEAYAKDIILQRLRRQLGF